MASLYRRPSTTMKRPMKKSHSDTDVAIGEFDGVFDFLVRGGVNGVKDIAGNLLSSG